MTVAIIALSVALAGSLAAIVYILRRQQSSLDAEVVAGKTHVADALALQETERQRDEAITGRAQAILDRDVARARLVTAQESIAKLREERSREAVDKIRNAPSGSAALAVLDELWSHVPGLPNTADRAPTGAGDDRTGAPAVQPAVVAE